MPRYEYICPLNGCRMEVQHRMSEQLSTWGELCQFAMKEPGDTPLEAPVEKVVNMAVVLRGRNSGEDVSAASDTSSSKPLHAWDCACCPPVTEAMRVFHEKIQRSAKR